MFTRLHLISELALCIGIAIMQTPRGKAPGLHSQYSEKQDMKNSTTTTNTQATQATSKPTTGKAKPRVKRTPEQNAAIAAKAAKTRAENKAKKEAALLAAKAATVKKDDTKGLLKEIGFAPITEQLYRVYDYKAINADRTLFRGFTIAAIAVSKLAKWNGAYLEYAPGATASNAHLVFEQLVGASAYTHHGKKIKTYKEYENEKGSKAYAFKMSPDGVEAFNKSFSSKGQYITTAAIVESFIKFITNGGKADIQGKKIKISLQAFKADRKAYAPDYALTKASK